MVNDTVQQGSVSGKEYVSEFSPWHLIESKTLFAAAEHSFLPFLLNLSHFQGQLVTIADLLQGERLAA
jgi:hypothetical protein